MPQPSRIVRPGSRPPEPSGSSAITEEIPIVVTTPQATLPNPGHSKTATHHMSKPQCLVDATEPPKQRWPKWAAVVWFIGLTAFGQWVVSQLVNSQLSIAGIRDNQATIRIALTIVVLLGCWYYTWMTLRDYDRKRPEAAKLAVPYDPELMLLDPRDLRRIMSNIVINDRDPSKSDKIILVAIRRHKLLPVTQTIIASFAYVAIAIAAPVAIMRAPLHVQAKLTQVPIGLLLLGLFTIAGCSMIWLKWSSWHLLATDKRSMVIVQWPGWLFWLHDSVITINTIEMSSCTFNAQDNWIGKIFKEPYGIVDIDGETDADDQLRCMRFIPKARKVSDCINGTKPAIAKASFM